MPVTGQQSSVAPGVASIVSDDRQTVGWREWARLPELGIDRIKVKIDTGARTSALHAFSVEAFQRDEARWVRFGIHPEQRRTTPEIWCEAPSLDRRMVRDSGGHEEERYVIVTPVTLGSLTWSIELTLTDRDNMGFRMLLGRTALQDAFIIDPASSYRVSSRKDPTRQKRKKSS